MEEPKENNLGTDREWRNLRKKIRNWQGMEEPKEKKLGTDREWRNLRKKNQLEEAEAWQKCNRQWHTLNRYFL